jgi:hypothetical protein
MIYDREKGKLVMADGTEYYANGGIVGLNDDLEISEGYDGGFYCYREDSDDGALPLAHRLELADYMIALWIKYKEAQK